MADAAKPLAELINRQLCEDGSAPLAGGKPVWPDTLRAHRNGAKKFLLPQPEVETKAAE